MAAFRIPLTRRMVCKGEHVAGLTSWVTRCLTCPIRVCVCVVDVPLSFLCLCASLSLSLHDGDFVFLGSLARLLPAACVPVPRGPVAHMLLPWMASRLRSVSRLDVLWMSMSAVVRWWVWGAAAPLCML